MVFSPQGFDEFFRITIARLVWFLIKIGASREEAEDAAQEAMTKVYESWDTVEQPQAWVRVVAERLFLATAARLKQAPGKAVAGGWGHAATSHDPDLAVLGQEQQQVLTLFRRLPYELSTDLEK